MTLMQGEGRPVPASRRDEFLGVAGYLLSHYGSNADGVRVRVQRVPVSASGFWARLVDLFFTADALNRGRLAAGFPDVALAVRLFESEDTGALWAKVDELQAATS